MDREKYVVPRWAVAPSVSLLTNLQEKWLGGLWTDAPPRTFL